MKKLKLRAGGIKEMLTKEQMKKISGGSTASEDATFACQNPEPNLLPCASIPDCNMTGCPEGYCCTDYDCLGWCSDDGITSYPCQTSVINCCPASDWC